MKKKPEPIVLYQEHEEMIPFKNRWGAWVFRKKNELADTNRPGFKNAKGWHPILVNGKWEWEEDEQK
ncbi:MAG: hypothetical protein NUV61_02115 [Candidatus Azambacteria bacterium]|nr:hypothetical protein [Candidatus Azambacteria bacterium]